MPEYLLRLQKNFSRTVSPARTAVVVPPVHLRFATGIRFTRKERLSGRIKTQLQTRHPHISADCGFTADVAMINPQADVNPPRRVPLLLRLPLVFLQPFGNDRQIGIKRRKRLSTPLLIAPRLAANGLLDHVARMSRRPSQFAEISPINPMGRPDKFILNHRKQLPSSS